MEVNHLEVGQKQVLFIKFILGDNGAGILFNDPLLR